MKTLVRSSTRGPVQSAVQSIHPVPPPTGTRVTVGSFRILQLIHGWFLTRAAPSVRRSSNLPVDTPACCSVTPAPALPVQRWCRCLVCVAKHNPSPVAVATRPGRVSSRVESCCSANSTPVHSRVTQSVRPVPESAFRSVCAAERSQRGPAPAPAGPASRCAALPSPVGTTPVRRCAVMATVLHVLAPSAGRVHVERPSHLCRVQRKCSHAATRAIAVWRV